MIRSLWGALVIGACVGASAATVYPVASGETLEVGATGAQDGTHNANTSIIDLQGGSTVKILTPTSGTAAYMWCSFVCTNGAAVLELSEGLTSCGFRYNFIVRSPGSLTINAKDCRSFILGHTTNSGNPSRNFAQYDLSGLTDIVDGTGASVASETTFQFAFPATVWAFPPASIPWSCKAATSLALAGSRMFSGTTIALGTSSGGIPANLILLNPDAIGADQTVTMDKWRSVTLHPDTVPDFASTQSLAWQNVESATFDFTLSSESSDAKLCSNTPSPVEFKGKVSGPIPIRAEEFSDSSEMTFSCTGDLSDWTGTARAAARQTLVLNASSVASAEFYAEGKLAFVAPADGGPSSVTIGTTQPLSGTTPWMALVAAAGQTIAVGAAAGWLDVTGSGTVDIQSVATGGTAVRVTSPATTTFNGASTPASYLTVPASALADGVSVWFLPDATGLFTGLPTWARPVATEAWYWAKGAITVDTLPAGVCIKSVDGASVPTVRLNAETSSSAGVSAGSSLKLSFSAYDWRSKAILWLDPSLDDAYVYVRAADDDTSTIQTGTQDGETCRIFRGLLDPRADVTLRAWNSRSWLYYSTAGYEVLASVHPLRATANSPVAGLSYMAFGAYSTSRRLQFVNWTEGMTGVSSAQAGAATIPAKFVVLVFGSQLGGGNGILHAGNAFVRSGKTLADPMMKQNANVWVNGGKVANPTNTPFSGSWDVISLDTSATSGIDYIGASSTSTGGGVYLGEMLFFDEVLSDADRRDVERYLAKKWGLLSKYTDGENVGAVSLAGSGTAQIVTNSSVQLSGTFAGTLDLGTGSAASLAEGRVPYTADEIAALEPAFWLDPGVASAVTYYTGSNWARIDKIYQRGDETAHAQIYATANGEGRAPVTKERAAFFGETRTWVDYGGTNETSTSYGNTLRLRQTGGSSDLQVSTKMGFIVQDSVRGGGTPFQDNIYGQGLVKARCEKSASDPIYVSGTTTNLTMSPVYLNGEQVAVADGFTGGPEVFTFTASSSFPVKYFEYYGNTEKGAQCGAIQGEILLFAEPLADETRSRVEGYLMKKWLGYTSTNIADYSSATLTGSGTFTAASAAVAPKLDSAFSGTYRITDTATFPMTLCTTETGATVDGAVVAPQATFALPETVTLVVALDGKPASGDYVLVQAADLGSSTFVLSGAAAEKRGVSLVTTETSVVLKVRSIGTTLLFR